MIRFSQNSIDDALSDGELLVDAIARAEALGAYPPDLPAIEVFDWQGQIFSLDNRRLYIAKEAGVDIRVTVRFPETNAEFDKISTITAGLSMEVR